MFQLRNTAQTILSDGYNRGCFWGRQRYAHLYLCQLQTKRVRLGVQSLVLSGMVEGQLVSRGTYATYA